MDQEGRAEPLCPCCDGNGEHSTHSGNDPRDLAYTCKRLRGYGTLTGIPNLVAGRRGRRESRWTGARVTDTLEIRPSHREPGTWTIRGSLPGTGPHGSSTDMVQLAHMILNNLEEHPSIPNPRQ